MHCFLRCGSGLSNKHTLQSVMGICFNACFYLEKTACDWFCYMLTPLSALLLPCLHGNNCITPQLQTTQQKGHCYLV